MTITIDLNASQIQGIHDGNRATRQRVGMAARDTLDAGRDFVFFAAFDGTNNDKDELAGDRFCTNVGQLWDQCKVAMAGNPHLGGGYFAGLGTRGRPSKETWQPSAVTAQVRLIAGRAYAECQAQATDWLTDHPGSSVRVALTGFSRGTASAAIFSQLLQQKGLLAPNGQRLAVGVSAGVLFDPVATGVDGNLAFPPNAENLVWLKALNEYRYLFRAVDYGRQALAVTAFGLYGNHCDVGGGYDNGLGALSLEAATAFLQAAGLPLENVPAERQFRPEEIAIHSEEYEDVGRTRNKLWDVYNEDGFSFADERLTDPDVTIVPSPPAADASGIRRFVLNDGTLIHL